MGKRPKKNVKLILVEGDSDQKVLKQSLEELYGGADDSVKVYFAQIMANIEGKDQIGGDITTCKYENLLGEVYWVRPVNIEEAICKMFIPGCREKNKFMIKDVTEVIHLVDLDGAYIDDACVEEDSTLPEDISPLYQEKRIICRKAVDILHRNERKRANIDYLSNLQTIKLDTKSIPYSIYYFSSNLDHFIHGEANMDRTDKMRAATAFADDYIGELEKFVKFFSEDEDAVKGMTYEESWKFIKQGNNSLHRHTNINLLLDRLWQSC